VPTCLYQELLVALFELLPLNLSVRLLAFISSQVETRDPSGVSISHKLDPLPYPHPLSIPEKGLPGQTRLCLPSIFARLCPPEVAAGPLLAAAHSAFGIGVWDWACQDLLLTHQSSLLHDIGVIKAACELFGVWGSRTRLGKREVSTSAIDFFLPRVLTHSPGGTDSDSYTLWYFHWPVPLSRRPFQSVGLRFLAAACLDIAAHRG
jgi:hypothetical protein